MQISHRRTHLYSNDGTRSSLEKRAAHLSLLYHSDGFIEAGNVPIIFAKILREPMFSSFSCVNYIVNKLLWDIVSGIRGEIWSLSRSIAASVKYQ